MANQELDESAKGVFAISATPFTDDGAVDGTSTDRMIDFYLESGVTGLTILGVMGEAPKMSPDESSDFCDQVLRRVDERVPVVVGVSAPSLNAIQSLTSRAMDFGASGVMVSPMAGLRTDEAIEGYFHMVCDALGDVPIVLQDYPTASGVHMSVPLLNRLFADLPSLKILKHEDWPGLRKVTKFRAAETAGAHRRVSILVGNGALFLPQELDRGVDGAMTGFAFPDMLVQVCEKHAAGDGQGAEDLFDAYLPLVRYEQQLGIGLAIRKETMRRRGVIASAKTRAPGPSLDADDHAELDHLIERLKRRLGELGVEAPDI
ncbi:MAG: dihydrodipicolinate synthase family protein [Proteobacteria bacterium]|nr:dihydrodipicolinate synthase family protein [Pseudomonadota bacterium]